MSKITVYNEKLSGINPFIYGNFMECIERHISGMWAEMLENRRLEDRLPDKSVPEHWRVYGNNNERTYSLDPDAFSGAVCQLITCNRRLGGWSGIAQPGIEVSKGREYSGYVFLKQNNLNGQVQVLLGKDYGVFFQPYAKVQIEGVTGEWKKYEFSFQSDASCDDAEFVVRFDGEGSLYIDHPSLMPSDNMMGWRRDVIEYIKLLKPNVLRFPGGCYADIYHWKNAIGDRDLRSPQDNYFWSDVPFDYMISDTRTKRNRRLTEPNDVGIDEFIDLCKLTDVTPLICVNLGTGTSEEAADWVEYCNGSTDTPMGALRAKNGRHEPYGILYWEIGNEMYGEWEIGYTGLDGYVDGYKRFHAAMKAADSSIKFLINANDRPWNREILRQCGNICDYLDVHFYPDWEIDIETRPLSEVFQNFFSRLEGIAERISEIREDIEAAGYAGRIKVAICEYSITARGWGPSRAFISTQGAALFISGLISLFQKNADIVEIGNFSNLTNAWWASAIRTNQQKIHATASYHVLSVFSNYNGETLLRSEVESGCFEGSSTPCLDAVASFDEENRAVVIAITNRTCRDDLSMEIDLKGFKQAGRTDVVCVSSPDMECLNDFGSPDRITPEKREITGGISAYRPEPCSLTLLRIYTVGEGVPDAPAKAQ